MPDAILHTDVLLVGGGSCGISTALSLATYSKHKITLIEQSDFNTIRVGEHISASIFNLLNYLKVNKNDFEEDCFIPAYASKVYWVNDKVSTTNSVFTPKEATFQLNQDKFDFKLIEVASERGVIISKNKKFII